jgi:crotonobetainyl-CoA:carnitine CoA-transferase CaiB-like acyl-CoA transferase
LVVNQTVAQESFAPAAIKTIATVASPLRLMDTPPVLHRPPPAMGQHTDEVLIGLGLDAAAIAALREAGVV